MGANLVAGTAGGRVVVVFGRHVRVQALCRQPSLGIWWGGTSDTSPAKFETRGHGVSGSPVPGYVDVKVAVPAARSHKRPIAARTAAAQSDDEGAWQTPGTIF